VDEVSTKGRKLDVVPASKLELPAGHVLGKLPLLGAVVGGVGLAATVALGMRDGQQAIHSYLVAFLYFLSLSLGALFFVLVQFATRAGWSVTVRRIAENVMGLLPAFALLFVPVALGTHSLYHWAHADAVAADPLLQWKSPYLNVLFFYARAVVYLLAWAVLALWYRRQSVKQDVSGAHALTRSMQRASGPAILVFAVTVTFAAVDWIMSLDPHWFSTIFGVYYFSGSVVSFFALLAIVAVLLTRKGPLDNIVTVEHFHDVGKLLLAFVAFWAYIAFSQYLLIWYANIPEETIWFAHRLEGTWMWVSVALALGHFVVPLFFLLPRTIKRKPATLVVGAVWVLVAHYIDLYWLVMPNLHPHGLHVAVTDITAFVGIGGLFVAGVAWLTTRVALIPARDPRLPEALSFENV
jgi:hypothetical protein